MPGPVPRADGTGCGGAARAAKPSRRGIFIRVLGAPLAAVLLASPAPAVEEGGKAYWLAFGKPARLCPGAREPIPLKMVGQAWGLLASGVLRCTDEGQAYALSVEYLNVMVDPAGRGGFQRERADFDWLGLALFRPDGRDGTDWLFDAASPIKGSLGRDATRRIVFSRIAFKVPKARADRATNMLLYLTFGAPVIAIRVL